MKLPRKIVIIFFISLILLSTPFLVNKAILIKADDNLDQIQSDIKKTQSKIDDISKQIDALKKGIDNLSGSLSGVLSSIKEIESEISNISSSIQKIDADINSKTQDLEKQMVIRNRTLRNYYKKGPQALEATILATQFLEKTNSTILSARYLKKYFDTSAEYIMDTNLDIEVNKKNREKLEELKKQVEGEKNKLVAIKVQTESKIAEQQKVLSSSNSDLESLQGKLDSLLAAQKKILSEKEGDFYASIGEDNVTDDPKSSINYNPGFSPAFGAFSYGAFTHYKGMSQYGAKGRAEDGKNYKDIIKFYYKSDIKEDGGIDNENICVTGVGNIKLKTYLYGIAEMPSTFPKEALRAQVIAARSYANRYKSTGKCICTTQACQVFLKSKSSSPPAAWKQAVEDTKDKLLSSDTVAYYSSTTGGYIESVGWDSKGDWPSGAYEKRAKSPWFYKAWYTKSYSVSSDKCGRSNPYLTQKEMSDILNAYIVFSKGSSSDRDHISPVTTSCWKGDPYSLDKMAQKADDYGGKVTNVSSISVSFSNSGKTSEVKFETNRGTLKISGDDFKNVFNLRAPGYISIKSRLFDIVRK